MMLSEYISKLGKELDIEDLVLRREEGIFSIPFQGEIEVIFSEVVGGILMQSPICPVPVVKSNLFFQRAMEANLFGRGTRGASIGLDTSGENLVLTLQLFSNMPYKQFKERLEDFISVLDFWKGEGLKWK